MVPGSLFVLSVDGSTQKCYSAILSFPSHSCSILVHGVGTSLDIATCSRHNNDTTDGWLPFGLLHFSPPSPSLDVGYSGSAWARGF
ncbi:hypothetical protein K491DRAFT_446418 [Lophiostoma macrostomum CBS 122681]|uniref:Uncharacterized protein n=1 Tax=Lophiostoma macrostomum CBS 122681 TaxID=1314788 RepID=A0A6A6T6V8_9PLEO|nr:hypothetical protein K491DRAFT_446418 [Lophiostoma macrostomum CBS 122681]